VEYSVVVREIVKDYFDLLFYGTFSISTLFLLLLFALSYRYKIIIRLLSYMGAAAIPFWFGIASKYFYDGYVCAPGAVCDRHAIVAFFVYFFVNGLLALGFWVLRSRQERAVAVSPARPA
jgi:hypothetical protein